MSMSKNWNTWEILCSNHFNVDNQMLLLHQKEKIVYYSFYKLQVKFFQTSIRYYNVPSKWMGYWKTLTQAVFKVR